MTYEEIDALWKGTPDSKRHKPRFLAQLWADRNDPNPSVERFIAAARFAVGSPQLDDPNTAPAYAAWLIEALLKPFTRLVETGKLDEVLPRLPALPILYSPHAGVGAGEWRYARDLYEEKRVGAECMMEHRGNDTELSRNPMWRNLATDTIATIQSAVLNLPKLRELRSKAMPCCTVSKRISDGARKAFEFELFRLADDELLAWPDWLSACEAIPRRAPNDLPVPVAQAREAYLCAARAVLDNFFADPDCPHAEEIVAAVRGIRDDLHRAQAVAEARKNVLDTIGRM